MTRPVVISAVGLGIILAGCVITWLYLRKQRKVEAGVALATVALIVAFGLPVLAKPIEDAWNPATGSQLPSMTAPASPVPAPDQREANIAPGWGPERQIFTMSRPAAYVTLNSISDNPNIGDERQFYGVRHVAADCKGNDSLWGRHEKISDGDRLQFRVYAENSVADSLDADGSHTIEDLRLRINFPDVVGDPKTESAGQAVTSAILTTANANPSKYWYVLLLSSESAVRLDLVPGTSKLQTNSFGSTGLSLPDSYFHDPGMQLGYDKLDGKLRAGYQYALYVSFCVKVSAIHPLTE